MAANTNRFLTRVKIHDVHWSVLGFIASYHLALLITVPIYFMHRMPGLDLLLMTLLLTGATLISITMGYHRYYAHKTYKAKRVLEVPLLFFGTASIQGSALKWAHDHRLHHKHVDQEDDPYGTDKGFWHSHILWLFKKPGPFHSRVVRDLEQNPWVRFQHRHYEVLSIATNVCLVATIALATGDWFGALVFGFLVRLFLTHHSTWFINSLAHMWGAKPYSTEHSAVNNFILSLLTYGEGYHNYHHTFSGDYRNGVRWYQFDPPKYFIWIMSKLGLASELQRVSKVQIHKKLVAADRKLMLKHLEGVNAERLAVEFVARVETMYDKLTDELSRMKTDLDRYRALKGQQAREEMALLKSQIKDKRRGIRRDLRDWQRLCKEVFRVQPQLA